jgi:AbrB family looped-hinge helix DNA binding protein
MTPPLARLSRVDHLAAFTLRSCLVLPDLTWTNFPMTKTRLSSKGQVIIPKAVRDRQGWRPGVELEVEDQGDAVLLRRARLFPPTTFEEVRGCLKYDGPPATIAEMDAAVAENVRRMWEDFERQQRRRK